MPLAMLGPRVQGEDAGSGMHGGRREEEASLRLDAGGERA